MTRLPLLALPLAAFSAVALTAPDADACSCAFGFTSFTAPQTAATDVPTNARVWIGHGELADPSNPQSVQLLDEGGAAVEYAYTEMTGNLDVVGVFTPVEPLIPGTTYRALDGDTVITSFTVGDGADADAPAVPVEVSREARSDARGPFPPSSCGWSDMVTMEVSSEGLFVVANVAGSDGLDTAALDGEVSEMTFDDTLHLGLAGCTFSWPDAEPMASTEVVYGTFDLAGNFSGWSDEDTIALPAAGTTGTGASCSAAGAESTGLALLIGLLGLAVRRR